MTCQGLPSEVAGGLRGASESPPLAPGLTQDALSPLSSTQVEDVGLLPTIRQVIGLYFNGEFLHKGAGVPGHRAGVMVTTVPTRAALLLVTPGLPSPHSPCSGVRVGIPGFLFHLQGSLGQQCPEPAWDVGAHVVHLVCVLPTAAGPIGVGPVGQDLHSTALTAGLLPALFLHQGGGSGQSRKGSSAPPLSSLRSPAQPGPLHSARALTPPFPPPRNPTLVRCSSRGGQDHSCCPVLHGACSPALIHASALFQAYWDYINWDLLLRTKDPCLSCGTSVPVQRGT